MGPWIGAAVALLLGAVFVTVAVKGKTLRALWGSIGAAALLCAVALGLLAVGVLDMGGDPAAVGDRFFAAVTEADSATVQENLRQGEALWTVPQLQAEGAEVLYDALLEHYAFVPAEAADVSGIYAVQRGTLTRLDLTRVAAALPEATEAALQQIVDSRPKREVFDEQGDYLSGIPKEAYLTAVQSVVADESCLVTETVELSYVWTFRGWKLTEAAAVVETMSEFDDFAAETAQQVQEGVRLLDKHYALDKHATVGQPADPACYGETEDPYEVQAVVDRASKLLDGQTLSWNPGLDFRPGGKIRYYLDETLLVIVWQEIRNFAVVTFAEVKVADPSQLVRRLSNDTLGDFSWQYPTTMAKESNAVVAISADFYMTRIIGVSVYQGEVFRNEPITLDHCFVDYDGNLILVKNKEVPKEDIPAFVEENNINFGVCFGPVLIRDGEKMPAPGYGIGEVSEIYGRSSIGQVGDLHYLLMTINSDSMYGNAGTITDSMNYMYEKNCIHAYALDGGKTATIVFNGELANRPMQRTLSDMICFVSAVPEEDR